MLRKTVSLYLIICLPAFAEDNTAQRIWQSTRQAVQHHNHEVLEQEVLEKNESFQPDDPSHQTVNEYQDAGQALFLAVNRQEWHSVRTLLAQYEHQTNHDQDIALFARAALARSQNQIKQSKQLYKILLQRQPDFIRGRLELARLLFEDQLNRESAAEFNSIPPENIPEPVQNNIRLYQNALAQRQTWQGSFSLGTVRNSNINEGSGDTEPARTECSPQWPDICYSFQGQAPNSRPTAGISYEAAASRRWQLYSHHGLNTRILAYGRFYRDSEYNEHTLNVSPGYQFANAERTLTAAPIWEWNSFNKHAQYRAYGMRTEWNETRSRWSWNTETEWKKLIYFNLDEQHNNGRLMSVFNTLSFVLRDDLIAFGGLDFQRRMAKDETESYRQPSLRFGIFKQFSTGFDTALNTLFRHRSYDTDNATLGKRRRDNEQIYVLTLGAERWKFAGMKPTLTLKHRRVNSNIRWLYRFRQNEIGLSLIKYF